MQTDKLVMVMRAGLIVGGAFLMFFGAILFFTIIFTPLGMLFGLVGFIMLIVGLVTSSRERVIVSPQTTVYTSPPPQPTGMKTCPNCGWGISENAKYCAHCGKPQESLITEPKPPSTPPQEPKVLAICPNCKNRIPSESKFCPECGENLQPKKHA